MDTTKFKGHTKGPWEVEGYSQDCDVRIEIFHDLKLLIDGIKKASWICTVDPGEDEITPSMEANACLIAAAPDLLAAVERLRELLGELYNFADEAVGCVDLDEVLPEDLVGRLPAELEED